MHGQSFCVCRKLQFVSLKVTSLKKILVSRDHNMLRMKLPSQFESCRAVAKPFVTSKGIKMGVKSRPSTLCFNKQTVPNSVRVNVKWMSLVLILQSVVINQEY